MFSICPICAHHSNVSFQLYPNGSSWSILVSDSRHHYGMQFCRSSQVLDRGSGDHSLSSVPGRSGSSMPQLSFSSSGRPLQTTRTVQGLTGAQSIRYQGDLQLNMVNTTGKQCSILIKGVYYNPALSYNLVSVSDMADNDYTSSFSRHGATLQGPAGMFDLIKASNVYLLPVNHKDDQGLGATCGKPNSNATYSNVPTLSDKMHLQQRQAQTPMTSHSISWICQRLRPYQAASIAPSSYVGTLDSCGPLYSSLKTCSEPSTG